MRINLSSILKATAMFLAVQQGISIIDAKVQTVSQETFESMKEFASKSSYMNWPPYFVKTPSGITYRDFDPRWLDPNVNQLRCQKVYQEPILGESIPAILIGENLTQEDCHDLKKEIIRGHVNLALNASLSEQSAYSTHYAFICNKDGCSKAYWPQINALSNYVRTNLAKWNITICPDVISKKTRIARTLYQDLSATIFAQVPEIFKNVCSEITSQFFHSKDEL